MQYISDIKRLAALVVVGIFFAITSQAQSFLTNGLVAYYPFSGNANDASGNGHDGAVYGAALTADRFGNANQAYLFGGLSEYITAPFSSTVFSNDFTVSVWVDASDYDNGWPTILSERGGDNGTDFALQIVGQTSVASPIGSLVSYASPGGAPSVGWSLQYLPQFPLNTWVEVVVTKAGTNVAMCLNGQIVVTNSVVDPNTPPSSTLYIGTEADNTAGSEWIFHGVIDDIRIYNRALSTNEVAALYAYESTPPTSFLTNGLVAYYPFDGNANDASGNGNNATAYNLVATNGNTGFSDDAFFFNGLNGYAEAPNSATLNPVNVSLSAWVNPDGLPHNGVIFNKHQYGVNNDGSWLLYVTPENKLTYWVNNTVATSTGNIPINQWTHCVFTYNTSNQNWTFYINGTMDSTGTNDLNTEATTLPLAIGSEPQSSDPTYFNGALENLRIYNRALPSNEVANLYAIESTPTQPAFLTNGLVAYYPFAGNANDASGNGWNGTPENSNGIPVLVPYSQGNLGILGSAIDLSGGDFVDLGLSVPTNVPDGLTQSFWLKSKQDLAQSPIAGDLKPIIFLTRRTLPIESTFGGWPTMCINERGNLGIDIDDDGYLSENQLTNIQANQVLNGEWHQVVGTKDGTIYSLFLDGNIVGQFTNTHQLSNSDGTHHIWLGRHVWNYQYPTDISDCDAALCNVRLYNRALSSNEVAQLYAYESTPVVFAPSIYSQPTPQTVNQGSPVSFNVSASGAGLNYQWQFDATNIVGATNDVFTIAGATTNNSGNYEVIVSNSSGSVTSSNVVLTVIPTPRTAIGIATLTGPFVTSVSIVDGGIGYTNTPLVRLIGGGGSGALAFAVVSNGTLISITVTNAGFGYTNAPIVVIEPPFISNPVLGISAYSFLVFSNLTVGGNYELQQALLWYWVDQSIDFDATNSVYTQMVAGANGEYRLALNPVPAQAFATAELVNDFVVGATVDNGGSGYVTSPAVTIVGGGGEGAEAYATISDGVVASITVTNAGFDYTNTPNIEIAPPPAASISPTVFPVMRVDSANLAPYDNYQIQFTPSLGGKWVNWNVGLYTPTATTNSQFIFVTNGAGFFRVQYAP